MKPKPAEYCDIEVWPLYNGKDITVAFIDKSGDDANATKDLLIVDLSPEEARALADILISASKCETDTPTYALRIIRVSDHE